MKLISKLLLAATLLAATFAAEAASGGRAYSYSSRSYATPRYGSSSGYTYRNPYAAYPSVSVQGYPRSTGTFVMPHYRTPANDTLTDNLSYRGYGTVRVPRY